MSENPYASPVEPVETSLDSELDPQELPIASQGKRFLNMIIDGVFLQVLSMASGFVFGAVYAGMKIAAGQQITVADQNTVQLLGSLLGLIVSVAYYILTEALFKRTLAKFLTGTYVVTAEGQVPSFGQIVGRSFARLIPFEAFSFLGGKFPVGWHDSLSGTRVVLKR